MTDKPLSRPRQATVSGWLIIVGSVLIVLLAFQRVTTLGSIEAQESAADLIAGPPGDGLGLSVDDVQLILRVLCFVAAGAATAAAILGWQVLQRSRSARLSLTILAPVLLVGGFAPAGFSAALVSAAIVMLWVQPTRDWFDGRVFVPPARPTPTQPPTSTASTPYPPYSSAPPPTGAPLPPPAASAASSWNLPAPGAHAHPTAHPIGQPSAERPSQVVTACIVAIITSAIMVAGSLVLLLFCTLSRDEALTAFDDMESSSLQGYSTESLVDIMIGFCAVVLVWSLVAIGLAIATINHSNGARIGLVASSVAAGVVSALGLVTLILLPAMVVTVVLLLRAESRAWFSAPR